MTPPTLPPSGGARSAGAAQDPFVERLADERVGEAEPVDADLGDQRCGQRLFEQAEHIALGHVEHGGQDAHLELETDDRSRPQDGLGLGLEA